MKCHRIMPGYAQSEANMDCLDNSIATMQNFGLRYNEAD
jgi:hypothetical protein